jgi:hypothetical protein
VVEQRPAKAHSYSLRDVTPVLSRFDDRYVESELARPTVIEPI